ncbi:MAG: BatA domain-containing protein, partial [Pirellulaceae bacterium]
MSFLAPLFLVGLAALAAPILMHMIRREAKGQQTFGSLIFLEASPPTMMRRSRIEHWLLLLLRSLAILLLVAAFARPYWRMAASPPMVTAHPRRVILLDRSASMSRAGIWDKASERVRQIIEETPPEISLGLYTFSHD